MSHFSFTNFKFSLFGEVLNFDVSSLREFNFVLKSSFSGIIILLTQFSSIAFLSNDVLSESLDVSEVLVSVLESASLFAEVSELLATTGVASTTLTIVSDPLSLEQVINKIKIKSVKIFFIFSFFLTTNSG